LIESIRAVANDDAERSLADFAFTADQLWPRPAPARVWHCPSLIPASAVTLFQANGGDGKSLLGAQLAVATVLGRLWLGQQVRRGNVLFLSCEDDRAEVHRRLEAIAHHYDSDLDELTGLKVLDLTGHNAVLAAPDRTGRLTPTDRWYELDQVAQAWEPALLIIDNLADTFAGEENSRAHARQFIGYLTGLARRTGAAVLLIGHPSLSGIASGSGSSGSTAWNNSVRSRLYLTRPAGDEAPALTPDARILTVKKSNYGPGSSEIRLTWRAGVFVADEAASAAPAGLSAQIAHNRIDRTFLDLLAAYDAQGRHVSHVPSANYAPALFAREQEAKGATKAGLAAAMNRLFAAGEIVVAITGPPSRQRHHIARKGEE